MKRNREADLLKVLDLASKRENVTFTQIQDLIKASPTYIAKYYLNENYEDSWISKKYLEKTRSKKGRPAYIITPHGKAKLLTMQLSDELKNPIKPIITEYFQKGYEVAPLRNFDKRWEDDSILIAWKEDGDKVEIIEVVKPRVYTFLPTVFQEFYYRIKETSSKGDRNKLLRLLYEASFNNLLEYSTKPERLDFYRKIFGELVTIRYVWLLRKKYIEFFRLCLLLLLNGKVTRETISEAVKEWFDTILADSYY